MNFSLTSLYKWYRNAIRHPKYRWWVIIGTIVYLISPLDISPDFLPIAGQIDDFMLVSLLVKELSEVILNRYKPQQDQNSSESATTARKTVDVEAVETGTVSSN
ncbi:YkvA family protein [Myxosarcina sp. GI1]|uniref:YkvA family protein n=1 Tax=Myxosarcina sp. GI1 TaxID=1541065 RepID=UPI00056A627E|nr:YkvA family protein [Myxosarcina sp. GI1]